MSGTCEQCSPLQFFLPVAEQVGPLDTYALVRPLVYDVNDDGHLDVVTPSVAGSSLTLTLGDGHGGFAAPERLETLVAPRVVVAGDFDGDERTDLAALGSSGIMLHWAPDNGVWARGQVVHDADPADTTFVTLATLKLPDETATRLVYVTHTSAGSGVYLTENVGGLKGMPIHSSTLPLSRVQTGDFDGDGKLDIAAWDKIGDMLWGQGGSSFQIAEGFIDPKNNRERPLLFADLDGDGLSDMLTGEGFGQGTLFYGYYYRTHLATPSGTFQELPRGDAVTSSTSAKVELGDFDHDGVPDLFSREEELSLLYTFKGVGDGSFVSHAATPVAADKNGIRSGDFDEDGQLDMVALYRGADAFTAHLGSADGVFASPLLDLPEGTHLRDAQIHHYPDLATPSIVVVGGLDEGRLRLLQLDSSLKLSQSQEVPIYRPLSLSLGDVDGDGQPDAIVPAERALFWVRYVGGQFAATAENLTSLGSIRQALSGDFAGTGQPQVVALLLGSPRSFVHVLHRQGAGWLDTSFEVAAGADMAVGNVLGDGLPELVIASSHTLQVFRIDAAGAASELAGVEIPWSYPQLDLADIDGDGDDEIVLGGFEAEGHAVYAGNEQGGIGQLAKADLPRFWQYDSIDAVRSRAADIDGDGLADLLEVSRAGLAKRWLGQGDGTFVRDETYLVPGSRELVGLDDFDADGHVDMLLKGGYEYSGALLVLRGATQCE